MAHRLAEEVVGDLDEIWIYIATGSGSVEVADRFVDSLTSRFYVLAVHPHLGRRRDDLRGGLRSFSVGEYIILYLVEDEDVQILRVLRGSRDLGALFSRS